MLGGFLLVLILAVIMGGIFSTDENADKRPWRNQVLGWFGKDPSEPSKEKMLAAVQKEIEISKKYAGRLASSRDDATREDVCLRLPSLPRETLGQEGIAFREVPGQSVRAVPKNVGGSAADVQARLDFLSEIDFFKKSEGSFQMNSEQILPAFRYELTQKGYANLLPGTDCLNVGKRVFDGIETITRTEDQVDGLSVYEVSYRLRVERAAWGNEPKIIEVFPELVNIQEDRFVLIKVLRGDDGWISMSEKKLELQKKLATLNLESGERRDEYQARILKMEEGDLPEIPSHEKLLNMVLYPENASSRSGDDLKNACFPLSFSLNSGDGGGDYRAIRQDIQEGKSVSIYFSNTKRRSDNEKNALNVLDAFQQAGLVEMDIVSNGTSARYTFAPDTIQLLGLDGNRRACIPLGKIKPGLLSVAPQGLTEQRVTLWAKVETPSIEAKQLARALPAIKAVLDEGYPIFASIRLSEEKGLQPVWKFSGSASYGFPEIRYTEFPVSVRQVFSSQLGNKPWRLVEPPIPDCPLPNTVQLPTPNTVQLPTLPEKEAGLNEAVSKNLIRHATEADFAAWSRARAAATPKINPQLLAEEERFIKYALRANKAYVVLKPFRYPAGLYGAHSASFLINRGVSAPVGDSGHSDVYDFNTLTACKFKCGAASR
ncbi:MAG: hypothetical protein LBU53_11495 [Zoogloeaceae bacterium]|jgi:hypothetical protein|nr:hypothetical protein [Zoogloeaceae bacterium]